MSFAEMWMGRFIICFLVSSGLVLTIFACQRRLLSSADNLANTLDPDQNIRPNLDINYMTL